MGYFPNGTSGDFYHEQYCQKCIHEDAQNDVFCPVWNLHLLFNYEECNKEDSFLHKLIPRDGIHNGQCVMFVKRREEPPSELPPESTAANIRSLEHLRTFLKGNWR